MPNCPNCGEIVMEGDPYCSHCGAHFIWDFDDEDDYERDSHQSELERIKQQRKNEYPYNDDFFNDLYHEGVLEIAIDRMSDGIEDLKRKFGVELKDVSIYNDIVHFELFKRDKYFDATLRASFDLSTSFNDVIFYRDIVTPDFSRLYSSEEFKRLIEKAEKEKNSKFHYCRLLAIEDMLMVSAVFDHRGYIVDLEKMELIE